LVNELLSFSKAAAGAQAIRMQAVDVADVVLESIKRESADGAPVWSHIPENLVVSADRELLIRAISNLVRNAIRYGGTAGPIEIRAKQEGNEIEIAIADSGPGVPEADLGRIFDAFYRVDTSRTRETGGAGLGLTIVKRCIESCGGTVSARNREPRGLEVVVWLATRESTVPLRETPLK
jgi:two-component system sensor histidine kinase CpxA